MFFGVCILSKSHPSAITTTKSQILPTNRSDENPHLELLLLVSVVVSVCVCAVRVCVVLQRRSLVLTLVR